MSKLREALPEPRWLWAPILLMPILVPIVTSNLSWLGIEHIPGTDAVLAPKVLVLALLLLVAAVAWMRQVRVGRMDVRWDDSLWLVCGLLGIAALSTFASMDPWQSVFGSYWFRQGLIVMLMLGVVVFLVVQLVRDTVAARVLASAVAIGAVPVALYALLQDAGIDPLYWGDVWWLQNRGISTIGNPDTLGGYLIIPSALALGLALSARRPRVRLAWWGVFGLCSIALVLTLVRGAWLGMLVAGLVYLAFVIKKRVRLERTDLIGLGLAVVLLLGVGVVARDAIAGRFEILMSSRAEESSGRAALWDAGVRVALDRPLLGTGPDAFRFGYYGVRTADHDWYGGFNVVADDAHNLPVMIAATLGIPALLLAIAFAFLVARRSVRTVFAAGDSAVDPVYAAWFAGASGYLVYLCFGPSIIVTNLMLALGFGVLIGTHARAAEMPSKEAATATAWAFVAIGLVASLTSGMTFVAEQYFVRSVKAQGDEAVAAVQSAISTSPWTWMYRAREVSLLADRAEQATQANWEATERDAIVAYRDLIRFSPAEYVTYVRFADTLLALPSQSEEVLELAAKVSDLGLAIYPHGLAARLRGARAYMRLEQYDKAVAILEEEWDSDSRFADPGVVYAYALLGLERTDDVLAVIDYLGEQFPKDEQVVRLVEIAGEIRGGQ